MLTMIRFSPYLGSALDNMTCCNCGCPLCGGMRENLQTCKVVEMYVCSSSTCSFSSLDLDEVQKHKYKKKHEGNRDVIHNVPMKRQKMDTSMLSDNSEVIIKRLEEIFTGNSSAQTSSVVERTDDVPVVQGNNPQNVASSSNPDSNFEQNRNESFDRPELDVCLEKRLSQLNSLSVVTMPALNADETLSRTAMSKHENFTDEDLLDGESALDEFQSDFNIKLQTDQEQEQSESRTARSSSPMVAVAEECDEDNGDSDRYTDYDSHSSICNDSQELDKSYSSSSDDEDYGKKDSQVFNNAEFKGFFKCTITNCHYKNNDPAELLIHEKEAHFQWAYEPCAENLTKALDKLTRYRPRRVPVKPYCAARLLCSICRMKFSESEEGTLHVVSDHGSELEDLVQVKCAYCVFTAAHPLTLVRHFNVRSYAYRHRYGVCTVLSLGNRYAYMMGC